MLKIVLQQQNKQTESIFQPIQLPQAQALRFALCTIPASQVLRIASAVAGVKDRIASATHCECYKQIKRRTEKAKKQSTNQSDKLVYVIQNATTAVGVHLPKYTPTAVKSSGKNAFDGFSPYRVFPSPDGYPFLFTPFR